MTKRAYVKPEWHAMGMPVAAANCGTGGGEFSTMSLCSTGHNAVSACEGGGNPIILPGQCVSGDVGGEGYCRTGGTGNPGPTCQTGNFAIH